MIFTKLSAPLLGAAVAVAGVTWVEDALPVTMMMRAEPVGVADNMYAVHVAGMKVKDCVIISDTIVGWYRAEGDWNESSIVSFSLDEALTNSAPSYYSTVGFGTFEFGNIPDGADSVKVTVVHNCDGRPEMTTMGPWIIERGAG